MNNILLSSFLITISSFFLLSSIFLPSSFLFFNSFSFLLVKLLFLSLSVLIFFDVLLISLLIGRVSTDSTYGWKCSNEQSTGTSICWSDSEYLHTCGAVCCSGYFHHMGSLSMDAQVTYYFYVLYYVLLLTLSIDYIYHLHFQYNISF